MGISALLCITSVHSLRLGVEDWEPPSILLRRTLSTPLFACLVYCSGLLLRLNMSGLAVRACPSDALV